MKIYVPRDPSEVRPSKGQIEHLVLECIADAFVPQDKQMASLSDAIYRSFPYLSRNYGISAHCRDIVRKITPVRDDKQAERFFKKRSAGIDSKRKDGSICDPENDVQSASAERWVCELVGSSFDKETRTSGDDYDCMLRGRTVDVKWMGFDSRGKARIEGNLIVNPYDPAKDIYVLVQGSCEEGFSCLGWIDRDSLESLPMRDFGYGRKYAAPPNKLRNIHELCDLNFVSHPGKKTTMRFAMAGLMNQMGVKYDAIGGSEIEAWETIDKDVVWVSSHLSSRLEDHLLARKHNTLIVPLNPDRMLNELKPFEALRETSGLISISLL